LTSPPRIGSVEIKRVDPIFQEPQSML
jgi:hypothetical protein